MSMAWWISGSVAIGEEDADVATGADSAVANFEVSLQRARRMIFHGLRKIALLCERYQ
jgi:hypothetical protein